MHELLFNKSTTNQTVTSQHGTVKPSSQQQQCRSNVRLRCQKRQQRRTKFRCSTSRNKLNMFNLFRLCRKDEISFYIVANNDNNVEATFNFVERIVRLVVFDNVASTLLLVWTGLRLRVFTADDVKYRSLNACLALECGPEKKLFSSSATFSPNIKTKKKPALTRVQQPTPAPSFVLHDVDLWPSDPNINAFSRLIVGHFCVKFDDLSWSIFEISCGRTDRQTDKPWCKPYPYDCRRRV